MAGKPRGSVVYNKPLQIFVTEEMAEKLKAQAVSQTNGRVSELGRKALGRMAAALGTQYRRLIAEVCGQAAIASGTFASFAPLWFGNGNARRP